MVGNQKKPRQKIIDQILVQLGNNMVDVELTFDDLNTAMDLAIEKYRQRSSSSVQESVFFLTLRPETQIYTLPEEIIEVVNIRRRGLSANSGGTTGQQYDPFSLAYTNLYLLQPTGQGDLYTYELYSGWLETAGKLFGATYDFRWDPNNHKLMILRHQQIMEDCVIEAYMTVSENNLLEGTYSRPWIRSFALAQSKLLLGQAYEKYSSLPGPNGSITLNGAQLKSEATAEMALLEEQLIKYQDGGRPLGFLIG